MLVFTRTTHAAPGSWRRHLNDDRPRRRRTARRPQPGAANASDGRLPHQGVSRFSSRPTSPPAASTCDTSRTSSTSTCPPRRRNTSTASAAPAAPATRATRWSSCRPTRGRFSPASRGNSSADCHARFSLISTTGRSRHRPSVSPSVLATVSRTGRQRLAQALGLLVAASHSRGQGRR